MSSTNVNRDTNAVDYLNWLRLYQSQVQAKNSAGTNFTPDYYLINSDTINITDTVTNNANANALSDSLTITDSITNTSQNSGTFVIDTATIDFSDIG